MPVYEYDCKKCNSAFDELIRTPSDETQAACPKCGSRNIERKPSVFAARAAAPAASLPMGGCGRCGDPQGPCSRG